MKGNGYVPVPASGVPEEVREAGGRLPHPQERVGQGLVEIARDGLEGGGPRKRVLIMGAGIAGLVAGYELRRQGHDVVILEAQGRVGGRVYTLRDFAPGLCAEAGAMRFPRVHDLALSYCEKFGLELRSFVMNNYKALGFIDGKRVTQKELNANPDILDFGLAEHERGRTYEQLWAEATREIRELYDREGAALLDRLGAEYDRFSIRSFLEHRGFSPGAIELYGVMSFRENNLNAAVIEQLREIVGRAFEDMQEIVGGSDRLPNAFYGRLSENLRFGHEVTAMEQDDDGVTLHVRVGPDRIRVHGDYAICTLPFSVLRGIEVRPRFSRGKQRAIRALNYNASTKILFQVRERFWERTDGIVGGTTVTDLPIRRIVYPSHSDPDEKRGVLLASYTWGQDALRWGAMSPEKRIEQALEDVAKIHPEITDSFEFGLSHSWYEDEHAAGAFALFEPGQQTDLHQHIEKPEGRIHFAGEHCSLWHAWIEGSLESGLRAARAIDAATAPERTETVLRGATRATDDIEHFLGTGLRGPDGTDLGTIHRIYFDDKTSCPEWAAITLDDGSDRLVPIRTATTDSGVLRVPYPRDRVLTSPAHAATTHIPAAEEKNLRRHYGIGTIITTMTSGSTSHPPPA